MPALETDLNLKLDDAAATALVQARTAYRNAAIQANVEARRLARPQLGKDGKLIPPDPGAHTMASTNASAAKLVYDGMIANALVVHAVPGEPAETLHDPAQGIIILKAQPEAKLAGQPPVERVRLPMSDKDADAYAASYAAMCAAGDALTDLRRKLNDYRDAHPALFAGSPGEPPPVDKDYEDLKVAHDAALATGREEQAVQGEIVQRVLADAGEAVTYYCHVSIATGDIVLGDRPEEIKDVAEKLG